MQTNPLILSAALLCGACSSTETTVDAPAEVERPATVLRVVPLRFAEATEAALAIKGAISGTRVVADARTNSLVISCRNEAEFRQLSECIAKLDIAVAPTK